MEGALHHLSVVETVATDFTCNQPMMEKLMTSEPKSTTELLPVMSRPLNTNVHQEVLHETNVLKSKAQELRPQHWPLSLHSVNADSVCNQQLMDKLPCIKFSSFAELANVDSTQIWEITTAEQTSCSTVEVLKSKAVSPQAVQQQIPFNTTAADSPGNQPAMGMLMFKEQSSVVKLFPVIPSTVEFLKNTTAAHREEVMKMKANDLPTTKQKETLNSKPTGTKYSQPVMENLESRELGSIEDRIINDEDVIIIEEDVIIIDPDPIHIQEGIVTEAISRHKEALKSKAGGLSTECQQVALNGRAAPSFCKQTKMDKTAFEDVIYTSEILSAIPIHIAVQGNYTNELEAFHEQNVLETKDGDPLYQHQPTQLDSKADNCIYNKHLMEKEMVAGDLCVNLELPSVLSIPINLKGSTRADQADPHEAKVLKTDYPNTTHGQCQKGPLHSETAKATSYQLEMGKLVAGDLDAIADLSPVESPSVDNYGNKNNHRKDKQDRLNSRAGSTIYNLPFSGMLEASELGCPVEMFFLSPLPMGNLERITSGDAAPTEQEVLLSNDIQPTQCQKHSGHQVTFDPLHSQSRDPGKANKKVTGVPFSEKPDGFDPSVSKARSDTSASKKQKHSKNSKDQKMIKALHKKQKEMASANQQTPPQPSWNSACTLEPDQDTDCQIIAVHEASPAASRHTISTATKHIKNNRKRLADKEVSIPSSMGFMDESLPKRECKPPALEGECTTAHPLNSPEIVEKTNKKAEKRKNDWGEETEITTVPQKSATPVYSEDTKNRLPTLCKKHFLDAKNKSIASKKPTVISAETISVINEFMKQRRPVQPAPLRKCQVVPHSIKDPIIDYFASCKMPKRPLLSTEFTTATHEKQIITVHSAAENKGPSMDFAGQSLVHRRMPQDITPSSHFPKTIHGPLNRHLPSTFRAPNHEGSYQMLYTQPQYEREAPTGAFPGQGTSYGRMAQASMPSFAVNTIMQVLSNHPPPISNAGIQSGHNQIIFPRPPIDPFEQKNK